MRGVFVVHQLAPAGRALTRFVLAATAALPRLVADRAGRQGGPGLVELVRIDVGGGERASGSRRTRLPHPLDVSREVAADPELPEGRLLVRRPGRDRQLRQDLLVVVVVKNA